MSLLKNILSPFVAFDEEKKVAEVSKSPVPSPVATAPINMPAQPQPQPDVPVPPTFDATLTNGAQSLPEHKAYFENLIEEANAKNPIFAGTDFKEFIDSKTDIDTIADEATRYRTAFSVLKRTGLTKERLLSTGQEYLNLIGRALNSYQGAFAQQYQKEVKGKETVLQAKATEVQALNQKIAALKADIKQISDDIALSQQKLDANKSSFLAAGETKQTEIQDELQKIQQYF